MVKVIIKRSSAVVAIALLPSAGEFNYELRELAKHNRPKMITSICQSKMGHVAGKYRFK
jgi:hypothetical protein